MSEEKLNEKLIKFEIQEICRDCVHLDKIVPIIREMLSESYINGLEQGKFDRQMLELEKQKCKEVLDEIKKICNSVPPTWSICGTDIIAKIEDVLREVE